MARDPTSLVYKLGTFQLDSGEIHKFIVTNEQEVDMRR